MLNPLANRRERAILTQPGRIDRLVTGSMDITTVMKKIESSTGVLKSLMNDVRSGKGFAGTMLPNEQFSTNMEAIANHLAVASGNLNRLGLWRFLWHQEPVPAPARYPATNPPVKP
jgi:hypothetical protein